MLQVAPTWIAKWEWMAYHTEKLVKAVDAFEEMYDGGYGAFHHWHGQFIVHLTVPDDTEDDA